MFNVTALSPEGTLLACSTPDGKRVVVYAVPAAVTTGTTTTTAALWPQCTLRLPPHHRSVVATTAASATTTDVVGAAAAPAVVLHWLSETHLAVRFIDTSFLVTVWDVTRGVVAYTMDSSSSSSSTVETHPAHVVDIASDATAATTDGLFYVACQQESSEKVVVKECSIRTGKLQRKIKAGKWRKNTDTTTAPAPSTTPTSAGRMAVSGDCLVLAGSSVGGGSDDAMIRVTDIHTGSKVSKIKLQHRHHDHHHPPPCLAVAGNIGCTIDGHNHHNHWRVFHLQTGATLSIHPPVAITAVPQGTTLQLRVDETDESAYWLLLSTTSSSDVSSNSHNKSQLIRFRVDDTVTPTTYTIETSCPVETPEDGTVLLLSPQTLVALNGDDEKAGSVRIQTFPLHEIMAPETETTALVVAWDKLKQSTADTTTTAAAGTKKRKEMTVLGPGQAGGEAHNVTEGDSRSKKRRGLISAVIKEDTQEEEEEDDDNNPTIAERLALLQQALDADDDDNSSGSDNEGTNSNNNKDNSRFVVKHATTESLTLLLQQALQSGDSGLLEQALSVRDVHTIRATCRSLSSAPAAALLQAVTTRLASKPGRAEQLCVWITAVLQSNQIDNVEHLQPLQNLLQERLEVFPLLLQLEGRLERLASSM